MHMKIASDIAKTFSGDKSRAQLIFEALAKGEISQETANKHTALLTADTLGDHPARPYPARGQILYGYIQGRLAGTIRRDQVLAKKNGEWIQAITRIKTQNVADYAFLMWAGRICRDIGAISQTDKIRAAVMKHIENHEDLSEQEFKDALDVQSLDSDEKRRGE